MPLDPIEFARRQTTASSRRGEVDRREFLCRTGLSLAAFGVLSSKTFGGVPEARSSNNAKPLLGVTYYPEQTLERYWSEDAAAIAKMGFTYVRAAEFSWSRLEPAEGKFDFDWLNRVIDGFHRVGVDVVLGTPSAAPPPWLSTKYPQVMLVDAEGKRLVPGGRRFTCPTNPTYRYLVNRIATQMGSHFAAAPGVIGWQIDNELALGRGMRCYCSFCSAGFRDWLRLRYRTVGAVNAAWGTAFWSQSYTDFRQISAPLPSGAVLNPSLQLDYYHFQSDSYVSFMEAQVAVLRSRCPAHWLTTNNLSIPTTDSIDLYRLTRELDFFSLDNYPGVMQVVGSFLKFGDLSAATLPAFIALNHDAARSVKHGAPFLVMEEQVGKVLQQRFSVAQPEPGQIRLWALQAIAHGARGVGFHRWDTERYGAEQFWFGILKHDRSPGTAFAEVEKTLRDIASLREVILAPYVAAIGLVYDYRAAWASAIQPGAGPQSYGGSVMDWYRAADAARLGIDVIDCSRDLSGYRFIVAPTMFTLTKPQADRIRTFVTQGGTFISGCRLGVEDEHGVVTDAPFPGLLRDVMGITVDDFGPLGGGSIALRVDPLVGKSSGKAAQWGETLNCTSATPLAFYAEGPWANRAALSVNRYGKGSAVYIGARIDGELLTAVFAAFLAAAGLKSEFTIPDGVEITRRGTPDDEWIFLLNHGSTAKQVGSPVPKVDLLSGEVLSNDIGLAPYQVRVLRDRS